MMMRDTIAVSLPTSQVRMMKWSVLGRDRSIPHFRRKLYHMVMGLLCFGLYAFILDKISAILLLAFLGGALVAFDVARLRSAPLNALALRYFGDLMRREELKSLSANSYYVLGLLLITIIFPKPIVLLSVLYLAVGDPIAAVVGTLHGKRKILFGKSVEGAAANFLVSAGATLLVAHFYFHLSPEKTLWLAFFGGITSAIAELSPLPINDNFSIPVISAVLLTFVFAVIPFL